MSGRLADRRILVVGASSGIGAAVAEAAIADGARVVVAARRKDRLDELVAKAGGGHAVTADVTDGEQVTGLAAQAVDRLGSVDLVFYASGIGVLNPMALFDPETWRRVFDVNVIGANLVASAMLPHLGNDGIVAFLSSRTVDDANWGFTSYAASKAALDQSIRAWRVEHPERRFVRIVMGNTQPTEFHTSMNSGNHDGDLIGPAIDQWQKQAIPGGMMHTDTVGRALADALAVALDHPTIDSSELKFDARP